ncbi:MAG: leucine-rich repeat domain-containing protein [Planctomycetota bacterium]|nr:leucine-rich repeat domain-containing protein [Planctomycetota bacterium]
MSDTKRRRRRYRQFSLYTFLVMLLLGCVWFGGEANRVNQQRQAVAWVLKMGGTVRYDYEVNEHGVEVPSAKATGPEWLRDYYHQVVHVYINDNPVCDLTPLANLRSLQVLFLSQTEVHDLKPLANLKSLHTLLFSGTSDGDLTPLANLKSLRELYLQGSSIRDLTPLANLKSLQVLNLHGSSIRDLTPLANLKNLRELGLRQMQADDLAPLANLTNLQELSLGDMSVSDLVPLANLKSLKQLDLWGTQVSEEQITKLQQALPNCRIYPVVRGLPGNQAQPAKREGGAPGAKSPVPARRQAAPIERLTDENGTGLIMDERRC